MAVSDFREMIEDVSTTIEKIFTVNPNTTSAMNFLSLFNKSSGDVIGQVELYPGGVPGSNIVLASNVLINKNRAFQFRGYRALVAGDEIWIKSNTVTALDAYISGLDHDAASSKIARGLIRGVGTSLTLLHTGPLTNGSINDIQCVNKGASESAVSIHIRKTGGAPTVPIYEEVMIPPNGDFHHVGAIGLLSGDLVLAKATVGSMIDISLSSI